MLLGFAIDLNIEADSVDNQHCWFLCFVYIPLNSCIKIEFHF